MASEETRVPGPASATAPSPDEASDQEDASAASGGSMRRVEFRDDSNTIVEHDDTFGSDDDSFGAPPPRPKLALDADAESSCSGSPGGSILRRRAGAGAAAAKLSRSLTTRSLGVQCCIPLDRDTTMEVLQRMQQDAEEAVESLEVQLRRATVEREQYRRLSEASAKALEVISAQKTALERREVELNRLVLQLNRELKAARKCDVGEGQSVLSELRGLEERVMAALSLRSTEPPAETAVGVGAAASWNAQGGLPPHPFGDRSSAPRPSGSGQPFQVSAAQRLLNATNDVGEKMDALQRQTATQHQELLAMMKSIRRDAQRPDSKRRDAPTGPPTSAPPTAGWIPAKQLQAASSQGRRPARPEAPSSVSVGHSEALDPSSSEWSSSESEQEKKPPEPRTVSKPAAAARAKTAGI